MGSGEEGGSLEISGHSEEEALTQVLALALAEGGAHRPLEHGLHVLHRSVARCPTGTSSSGCSRPAP